MGHSDQAMQDLAAYESQLDRDAEFDEAVDRKTGEIASEFLRECSYGSPEECALLGDAIAGLTGDKFNLMLGDLAANGKQLKEFIQSVITTYAETKAVEHVRNATARGKS